MPQDVGLEKPVGQFLDGKSHITANYLESNKCNGVMLFLHVFFIQEHRVVVRIDSWESTSLYPNGHSVRVLGRAGELETEVQTILIENCIHAAPFSDAQVR